MRLLVLLALAGVLSLFAYSPARAAEAKIAAARPTVTVHATASVTDTYFTLGEIADIQGGSADLDKQLAAAPMGRAPLPGEPRPLNTGDISLKLRQAGINPSTITLAGATTVVITSAGGNAGGDQSPLPGAAGPSGQGKTIAVRAGDAVNLVYIDGNISITARAVALQNGAVGDQICLRRSGVGHSLYGTVLDSQTVQLED